MGRSSIYHTAPTRITQFSPESQPNLSAASFPAKTKSEIHMYSVHLFSDVVGVPCCAPGARHPRVPRELRPDTCGRRPLAAVQGGAVLVRGSCSTTPHENKMLDPPPPPALRKLKVKVSRQSALSSRSLRATYVRDLSCTFCYLKPRHAVKYRPILEMSRSIATRAKHKTKVKYHISNAPLPSLWLKPTATTTTTKTTKQARAGRGQDAARAVGGGVGQLPGVAADPAGAREGRRGPAQPVGRDAHASSGACLRIVFVGAVGFASQ